MTDAKVTRCAYIILRLFMNAFAYIHLKRCELPFLTAKHPLYRTWQKQGIEKFMISRIFCAWKKLKMYNLLAKSNSYMDIVSNFSLMQIFWEGQKSPNGFLIMWPSQNIWTKTKSADVILKMTIEFSPLEIT